MILNFVGGSTRVFYLVHSLVGLLVRGARFPLAGAQKQEANAHHNENVCYVEDSCVQIPQPDHNEVNHSTIIEESVQQIAACSCHQLDKTRYHHSPDLLDANEHQTAHPSR